MINMSECCRVKEMNFQALGLQKEKKKSVKNSLWTAKQKSSNLAENGKKRLRPSNATPVNSLGWKPQLSSPTSPRQQYLNEGACASGSGAALWTG